MKRHTGVVVASAGTVNPHGSSSESAWHHVLSSGKCGVPRFERFELCCFRNETCGEKLRLALSNRPGFAARNACLLLSYQSA